MSIEFTVELCKDKGGWASKPSEPLKLNLEALANEFKTSIKTQILLVIEIENTEVIVHNHGEIIFKYLENKEKINKIAKMIYEKAALVTKNA